MGGFGPTPSAAAQSPLPPLHLPAAPAAGGRGDASAQPPGFLQSLVSGIAPIKAAVDSIMAACQQIVRSGAVPGSEQVCAQIVALANSLVPMAAQQALQPGMGGPSPGGAGGGLNMMAPPGPPAPVGGGGGMPPGGGGPGMTG